jgi:hypothetical protein
MDFLTLPTQQEKQPPRHNPSFTRSDLELLLSVIRFAVNFHKRMNLIDDLMQVISEALSSPWFEYSSSLLINS